VIPPFRFARPPELIFGAGAFDGLGNLVDKLGTRVLLVTGENSLTATGKLDALTDDLKGRAIGFIHYSIRGEPSPEIVDDAVAGLSGENIDVVLAVGGGSVIDTGKAISAMYPLHTSVFDYLEGVGTGVEHPGVKVPFLAVPTTAGTGSEATKNAVLSRKGPDGFKRSLRHDNFVPDLAVIDPELSLNCPPELTAVCGLDTFTQLLESYVSTGSNPLTDALAFSGLEQVNRNLVPACTDRAGKIEVRAGMAYASFLSGITLANAGLGTIHGFASSIGGLFDIPHGVVCGALMAAANELTIEGLRKNESANRAFLEKYARIGSLFSESDPSDIRGSCDALIQKLYQLTEVFRIPVLNDYGIGSAEIKKIAEETGNKNNPYELNSSELREVLLKSNDR